jgi:A/G-specific adenine glycosylase
MLQQTQVPRVLEKYKEFLKRFPTVHTLAKASLTEVLKVWSGLGYNRRGKYLHDAARHIVESYAGIIPHDYPALRAIPGIGMYTANAVRVFAFNEAEVLLETNVRTAIIHHFLSEKRRVEDSEIEKIAAAAAEGQDPRTWHSALFDYGSYLKQRGVRVNTKSTQYVRQSKFEGSLRQVRGAILRALHTGATTEPQLYLLTCASKQVDSRKKFKSALTGLVRDGLVAKAKGDWKIA